MAAAGGVGWAEQPASDAGQLDDGGGAQADVRKSMKGADARH